MTAADPGRFLLDKTGAREQALAREAGQAAACTLWVSSTTRLGSAFRPFFSRACQRSRS
jgi:hypothetical protein